ncbi:MAG: transposase, partial [Lachnospiraceae bacterium]|nr:transposase [Lachnospiraceae bacterium]
MLKLEQCRKLSYDALTAYVSIVFVRYMFLSYEKRNDEDDRTIGELMFLISDEMQDITFNHSMVIITQALFDAVTEILSLTKEQLEALTESFLSHLPVFLRNSLNITVK